MNVGLAVIVVSGQVILNIIKNHLTNTVIIVNIVFVKTEKKLRKLGFFFVCKERSKKQLSIRLKSSRLRKSITCVFVHIKPSRAKRFIPLGLR